MTRIIPTSLFGATLLIGLIANFDRTPFAQPIWFKNFRRIELGTTHRREVEKLFTDYKIRSERNAGWTTEVVYSKGSTQLWVDYSQGRCSENGTRGYDIEKDKVVSVFLTLRKRVTYAHLGINVAKYDKREISDLPNMFTFANSDMTDYFNGTITELRTYTRRLPRLDCQSDT